MVESYFSPSIFKMVTSLTHDFFFKLYFLKYSNLVSCLSPLKNVMVISTSS